ncbi:ABC transporter substrate-binding protein [Paractinoplanes rishiriensis]|uniref:ABC transporter substrate-binding protein n=1 Tax=Paractinoplanes rishiriensis TaxID=1050105 RepID=A0A919N008_9ACTN|nr:extracellular solute-binding protein [Actinoplanes rishiriensis]GIE94492.1 ABC transporter substrate-binding protein [Actinoplanes rishiriensis]
MTSRRDLLRATGGLALGAAFGGTLAGCASEEDAGPGGPAAPPSGAPAETYAEPAAKLSGNLSILLWSHFVPSHDTWFDRFAKEWGTKAGVNVTVDHIDQAQITTRIAAEIAAGQGHDMIQFIAPLSQFEPSVLDLKDLTDEAVKRWGKQLELCTKSSFNPSTGKFYAYSPGWVPDPGNYRKSLWEPAGFPNGPASWDDLLKGGAQIKKSQGVQMGLGMSQEIDSNMVLRGLMWTHGASIQDANERVVINSPETIQAVEFMARLFKDTMTNEVFSWNAASNNQGLVAGKMSYIVNSISAWRTSQGTNPQVADDVHFVPALRGPAGQFAAQHVLYNWIVPKHARNPDAAKEFLLHYTGNFAAATYASKLYDFCAFDGRTPGLKGWLASDPFGGKPADKLSLLADATAWSVNIGHPGPANTAEGEIFNTFVIPNMFARVARGEQTAQQSVSAAEAQVNAVFTKWRQQGLVGKG